MERAREEFRGGGSLEAELSCPICLSRYRNPVLLRCGHSFCKHCIQKTLGAQQQSKATYSCPVCKFQLEPTLELQKNFQLRNIVEIILPSAPEGQQDEGSAEGKEEVVPCDYCLDEPQPAVKTCLSCDAALCQAHLNKHNAKASQQDHVLVEVGAGSGAAERRCPEHGRLLECFCQDEGQYICVLCPVLGRHKGHSIITLKEAHNKQLGELSATVTRLQEHKSALTTALEELQKNENRVKTNTKTVTSQLQKLFEEMRTAMIQKEEKILSDFLSIENKQLADITKVKKKMEERRDEAVKHLQSLQEMRVEPDIFLFFKEFKLAKDRIASQDFSNTTMAVMLVQLDEAWINQYRQQMWSFMSQLDKQLQIITCQLNNQIRRSSEASFFGTSSNSKHSKISVTPPYSGCGPLRENISESLFFPSSSAFSTETLSGPPSFLFGSSTSYFPREDEALTSAFLQCQAAPPESLSPDSKT